VTRLVLLRHGESLWNKENLFTGWTDVDLSELGGEEAREAGRLLKKEGYAFDLAFTSVLKRAIRTLWSVLDVMDLMWIPVYRDWRLNERHYGALQGLNKEETAAKYGEAQVKIWRRSYDIRPPELASEDPRHPRFEPRYSSLDPDLLPASEIRSGRRILVTAHGNSLRALIKHLDGISDSDIAELNIPTGIPLVYELDEAMAPIRHYYLGDQGRVEAAVKAVAAQGATKKGGSA